MKKKNDVTAENITRTLMDTMSSVSNKKMTPQVANAVATQAREINRIIKTQILIANMPKEKAAMFDVFQNGE